MTRLIFHEYGVWSVGVITLLELIGESRLYTCKMQTYIYTAKAAFNGIIGNKKDLLVFNIN